MRERGVKCVITVINCWVIVAADILWWYAIIMCKYKSHLWRFLIIFLVFFFSAARANFLTRRFHLILKWPHSYLIPQYVHMKAGVRSAGRRCEESNAWMERSACPREPLITWTWFSRQISPRGWLNTIAFPSSKSQVCVAKHATRQWKLAVWMMVITLTTEAANASFQEGAVWWASLMSLQEQEFIYLLLVWLNCSAGEAYRQSGCLPNNALSLYVQSIYPIL